MGFHHLREGAANEAAGGLEPGIQEHRAQRGFQRIGQHRGLPLHPGTDLPRRHIQRGAQPDLLRDLRQHRLGNQMAEPAAKAAFLLVGEPLGKPFGDQQAEHAVADEFQPFVGAGALDPAPFGTRTRMGGGPVGQRLAQQFGAGELMAENALERVRQSQCTPVNSRDQRISNGHCQNCHHG